MNDPKYHRFATLLIGSILLFRLAYAAIFPVNPVGDEAYYWDWGRQLDYGYYSKPPFIAWLYAFVDWIGGGSLFAIRATASVIGCFSLLILYRLASAQYGSRTGWYALVIGVAIPANTVLGYLLTIDAPLTLCWSVALWMLWRYLKGKQPTVSLAILFLALTIGHLSKQMMMVFPILAILLISLQSDTRPFLKRTGLWLSLLSSYLALIPPLIWNSKNGWITFKHTIHHFESVGEGGNVFFERLEDFFEFLATQLGVLSPVFAVTLYAICIGRLRTIRSASLPVRFTLVFGGIPLVGILLLAMRQGLQPNWPAVFYVSCLPLLAAFFTGSAEFAKPSHQARKQLFISGLTIGFALSAFFYFGSSIMKLAGIPGHKADPNRRLMGYDEMASGFEELRRSQPDADDLFITTYGHRDITSQLAFGLPDQPRVYRWEQYDFIGSQYELWNNPFEDGFEGKDGLIMAPRSHDLPRHLRDVFESIEKLGEFEAVFSYDRSLFYSVFRGNSLQRWPNPVPVPKS